mmetsp:Transcript_4990/g.12517  ORF Transcript_4990/g.12517 Transcript_4990/m.12517 type:complete len:1382 (-) Transcript_4990:476-4621(-)
MVSVAVLGGAGSVGQALSLLLNSNENIGDLRIFDVHPEITEGIALELDQLDTGCQNVTAFVGLRNLPKAVRHADLIIIAAGANSVPGGSDDDLLATNARILKQLAESIALHHGKANGLRAAGAAPSPPSGGGTSTTKTTNGTRTESPGAAPAAAGTGAAPPIVAILSERSDLLAGKVALVAEVFKHYNVWDPRRLMGVTAVDVLRTRKLVGDYFFPDEAAAARSPSRSGSGAVPVGGTNTKTKRTRQDIVVDVVGGAEGKTIVPLLSMAHLVSGGSSASSSPSKQQKIALQLPRVDAVRITQEVQRANKRIADIKRPHGQGPTLAAARAAYVFLERIVRMLAAGGATRTTSISEVDSEQLATTIESSSNVMQPYRDCCFVAVEHADEIDVEGGAPVLLDRQLPFQACPVQIGRSGVVEKVFSFDRSQWSLLEKDLWEKHVVPTVSFQTAEGIRMARELLQAEEGNSTSEERDMLSASTGGELVLAANAQQQEQPAVAGLGVAIDRPNNRPPLLKLGPGSRTLGSGTRSVSESPATRRTGTRSRSGTPSAALRRGAGPPSTNATTGGTIGNMGQGLLLDNATPMRLVNSTRTRLRSPAAPFAERYRPIVSPPTRSQSLRTFPLAGRFFPQPAAPALCQPSKTASEQAAGAGVPPAAASSSASSGSGRGGAQRELPAAASAASISAKNKDDVTTSNTSQTSTGAGFDATSAAIRACELIRSKQNRILPPAKLLAEQQERFKNSHHFAKQQMFMGAVSSVQADLSRITGAAKTQAKACGYVAGSPGVGVVVAVGSGSGASLATGKMTTGAPTAPLSISMKTTRQPFYGVDQGSLASAASAQLAPTPFLGLNLDSKANSTTSVLNMLQSRNKEPAKQKQQPDAHDRAHAREGQTKKQDAQQLNDNAAQRQKQTPALVVGQQVGAAGLAAPAAFSKTSSTTPQELPRGEAASSAAPAAANSAEVEEDSSDIAQLYEEFQQLKQDVLSSTVRTSKPAVLAAHDVPRGQDPVVAGSSSKMSWSSTSSSKKTSSKQLAPSMLETLERVAKEPSPAGKTDSELRKDLEALAGFAGVAAGAAGGTTTAAPSPEAIALLKKVKSHLETGTAAAAGATTRTAAAVAATAASSSAPPASASARPGAVGGKKGLPGKKGKGKNTTTTPKAVLVPGVEHDTLMGTLSAIESQFEPAEGPSSSSAVPPAGAGTTCTTTRTTASSSKTLTSTAAVATAPARPGRGPGASAGGRSQSPSAPPQFQSHSLNGTMKDRGLKGATPAGGNLRNGSVTTATTSPRLSGGPPEGTKEDKRGAPPASSTTAASAVAPINQLRTRGSAAPVTSSVHPDFHERGTAGNVPTAGTVIGQTSGNTVSSPKSLKGRSKGPPRSPPAQRVL